MSRIDYNKITPGTTKTDPATLPAKRALPEAGRISIGDKGKTKEGKEYPRSTDYFVIRGSNALALQAIYGDKPTSLPIFFYSDDFEDVCSERLEIRDSAGRLFGYGDGETFHIYNPKTGEYVTVKTTERPDIMEATKAFLKQDWAAVLTVRFAIRGVPVLGYWQFSTRAIKTSIPNLRDRFDECLAAFGTVRFFPFMLNVKKVKSNKPGDSKQYPVVDILPQFSIETGLKLAEYLTANPDFNQARLALMKPEELAGMPAQTKLLKGGEEL